MSQLAESYIKPLTRQVQQHRRQLRARWRNTLTSVIATSLNQLLYRDLGRIQRISLLPP